MTGRRTALRDRLTLGLAALAAVAIVAVNLLGLFRHSSAAPGSGSLAAAWQTFGGGAAWHNACHAGCPDTTVVVRSDGSYTVTTLFSPTNGDTTGHLTPAQAAELAQGRANPDLPTAAPADCGSYLLVPHVKITVVTTDGVSRTLDTCLADVPSSNPLIQLLQSLVPAP